MWFPGAIAEAILKSKSDGALLLVFIKNENEDSIRMCEMWNDPTVIHRCQSAGVVALQLDENTESAKQFAQIYPVLQFPSSFLIGRNGVPLEIIVGCPEDMRVTKLLDTLDKVIESHESGIEKIASSSQASAVPQIQPQSPPPVKAPSAALNQEQVQKTVEPEQKDTVGAEEPITDRIAHAADLVRQRREQKEKEALEEQKKREKQRREDGRQSQETKQRQMEMEMKELAQERKKQRAADKEALRRVKEQIAADRAEKHSNYVAEKSAEDEAKSEEMQKRMQEKKEKEAAELAARYSIARIQIRFPDGTFEAEQFESDELLQAVVDFIRERRDLAKFTLIQMYPRREFNETDMISSLRELELAPSATLMLMPESGRLLTRRAPTGSWGEAIWGWVMAPFNYCYNIMASFLGLRTAQPAVKDESSGTRKGNMSQMRADRGEDDNATWNGNSTQQL